MVKIYGNGRCGCDWCRKQTKTKDQPKTIYSRKEKKILGIKDGK